MWKKEFKPYPFDKVFTYNQVWIREVTVQQISMGQGRGKFLYTTSYWPPTYEVFKTAEEAQRAFIKMKQKKINELTKEIKNIQKW